MVVPYMDTRCKAAAAARLSDAWISATQLDAAVRIENRQLAARGWYYMRPSIKDHTTAATDKGICTVYVGGTSYHQRALGVELRGRLRGGRSAITATRASARRSV